MIGSARIIIIVAALSVLAGPGNACPTINGVFWGPTFKNDQGEERQALAEINTSIQSGKVIYSVGADKFIANGTWTSYQRDASNIEARITCRRNSLIIEIRRAEKLDILTICTYEKVDDFTLLKICAPESQRPNGYYRKRR